MVNEELWAVWLHCSQMGLTAGEARLVTTLVDSGQGLMVEELYDRLMGPEFVSKAPKDNMRVQVSAINKKTATSGIRVDSVKVLLPDLTLKGPARRRVRYVAVVDWTKKALPFWPEKEGPYKKFRRKKAA